jgi:formate dehydrogenase
MAPGHRFKAYLPAAPRAASCPPAWPTCRLTPGTLAARVLRRVAHAVVILSEHDDMKAVALNLMLLSRTSCGQCTPCRVGTEKAAKLMANGPWDPSLLDELSAAMRDASICGLGQAAPNPLLCVLKYFPEELGKPLGGW